MLCCANHDVGAPFRIGLIVEALLFGRRKGFKLPVLNGQQDEIDFRRQRRQSFAQPAAAAATIGVSRAPPAKRFRIVVGEGVVRADIVASQPADARALMLQDERLTRRFDVAAAADQGVAPLFKVNQRIFESIVAKIVYVISGKIHHIHIQHIEDSRVFLQHAHAVGAA